MDGELVSPEGTQEGKNSCHLAAIRLQPIPTVSPEETQDLKMGLWPQIAEMHIKGMISVSSDSPVFLGVVQFSSVQLLSCPTLCDPMNCSTPGLPVHHQLLEFTQTQVHQVSDAIQPSHLLLSVGGRHEALRPWQRS